MAPDIRRLSTCLLVGAFFIDIANVVIIKALLGWVA